MRLGLAAALVVATWLWPASALAHHVPGHGASEGVRSINSLGNRGARPQTRLLLLNEFSTNSTSLNPGQVYLISALGEYAPVPEISLGAQAPLLVVDEKNAAPKVGYGDTRLLVRFTPHARKLIHRVVTLGLNASFPTRTLRFVSDPGRTWIVAPNMFFTRTYSRLFWQLLAVTTVEHRPAGTSLDMSAGGQIGYKFLRGKLSPGVGVLADLRVATWCEQPDGSAEYCVGNRVTEIEREVGSTRATALATFAYNFKTWGSLTLGLQVPFTPKRDFDFGASLGVQFFF